MGSSCNAKSKNEVIEAVNEENLNNVKMYLMKDIEAKDGVEKSKRAEDMNIDEPCTFNGSKIMLVIEVFEETGKHYVN